MKKEFENAVIAIIVFISILWLEKPLRSILLSYDIEFYKAKYSAGISVRFCLIILSLLLIRKLNFIKFTSLDNPKNLSNIQSLIIPLVFISIGLLGSWGNYVNAGALKLLLFTLSVLSIGILEELFFRGIIFPLCIKAFKNYKRAILIAAILSSSCFGIIHFVNLFSQPDNLLGITSQVFFALSIGVFFSGLLVRIGNILVPAIIHVLVNFSFGSSELKPLVDDITTISENTGVNWNSLIPTTLFFAFIFAGGLFMILNCNKEELFTKLEIDGKPSN